MKKKKGKNKIFVRIFSVILIILCWIWFFESAPANFRGKVFVSVGKGDSLRKISAELKENGIIKNEKIFIIIARLCGADKKIIPGTHIFTGGMSPSAVAKELTKNHSRTVRVTIPEGWTAAQIQNRLDRLPKEFSSVGENFTENAVNPSSVSYEHFYGDSYEGYLFPDTYVIEEGTSSKEFIEKMVKDFDRVQSRYFTQISECGEKYFGTDDYNEALYKVITVASLIERECRTDGEREKIASVIYNRLKKGMPLQIDATVSYRPGESTDNKNKVYLRDTKKKTPYNTYVIKGLPKGPICNPGEKCIRAAVNPEKTDYLYYVAKSDGSHIFSKTFEEHKTNKKRVR